MKPSNNRDPSEVDFIDAGDIVNVHFETEILFSVRVRHRPIAIGDCWHFISKNGEPIVVQSFNYIVRPKVK